MQHSNKIFAIGVIMLLLSLVGFCLTVNMIRGFSKLDRLPATDSLSGNAGNYFIDLPQDIEHSSGTDMVARVSGDTVYVYYPDYKAHLKGINGLGDYQLRLNRNITNTDVASFTLTDGSRDVVTLKDSILDNLILNDNR